MNSPTTYSPNNPPEPALRKRVHDPAETAMAPAALSAINDRKVRKRENPDIETTARTAANQNQRTLDSTNRNLIDARAEPSTEADIHTLPVGTATTSIGTEYRITHITHTYFAPQTPTTSTPYIPSLSRRSTYPRASPPNFLHPELIAPVQSYNATARPNYDFPALPTSLIVLVFVSIILGCTWAAIVYFISFPPKTTAKKQKKDSNSNSDERKLSHFLPQWLAQKLGIGRTAGYTSLQEKKKPLDKPSKYAPLPSNTSEASPSSSTGISPSSVHENGAPAGLKLRKWKKDAETLTERDEISDEQATHRKEDTALHISTPTPRISSRPIPTSRPASTALDIGQATQRREDTGLHVSTTTPRSSSRRIITTTQSSSFDIPTPLPQPPQLPSPPPLSRKSSTTWLAERAAYFTNHPSSPPSASSYSSSYSSLSDIDVLEAQTPRSPYSGRGFRFDFLGKGGQDVTPVGSPLMTGAGWLGMVDGAVTRAVERVARWTEDRGGDEGLLLPVAEGGERG